MLMADVLTVTFLILGAIVSFQGLWLLCLALWPRSVERSAAILATRPRQAFIVGIATLTIIVVPVVILLQLAPFAKFIAIVLGCLGFLYSSCGVAGLATHVGRRLVSPADRDRPWKATLRGGVTLGLAYPFPIVGWFAILPGSFILGAGAMSLGWWLKQDPLAPPIATENGNGEHDARGA